MPLTADKRRLAWPVLAVLWFTTPPPGSIAMAIFLLLLEPTPARGVWAAETDPWRELADCVARTGRPTGLDVVDLIPVLAARGGNWAHWRVMPYDPHPTAAADSLAADFVTARIVERGCLGGTASAQAPDTAPAMRSRHTRRARRAAQH